MSITRFTGVSGPGDSRELVEQVTMTDDVGTNAIARRKATDVVNRLCADPKMWGTHGLPSEAKRARLEEEFAAAFADGSAINSRLPSEEEICRVMAEQLEFDGPKGIVVIGLKDTAKAILSLLKGEGK